MEIHEIEVSSLTGRCAEPEVALTMRRRVERYYESFQTTQPTYPQYLRTHLLYAFTSTSVNGDRYLDLQAVCEQMVRAVGMPFQRVSKEPILMRSRLTNGHTVVQSAAIALPPGTSAKFCEVASTETDKWIEKGYIVGFMRGSEMTDPYSAIDAVVDWQTIKEEIAWATVF